MNIGAVVGGVYATVFYGQNNTGYQDLLNVRVADGVTDLGADSASNTPDTNLTFSTRQGAGALTEQMRIEADGKVGIGTGAPQSFLHVTAPSTYGDQGHVAVFEHDFGGDAGFTENSIQLNNKNSATSKENNIEFAADGNIQYWIITDCYDTGAHNFCITDGQPAYSVPFYLSGSTGNVNLGDTTGNVGIGIGATNAANHKLDVAGNIGLTTSGYINFGATDGSTGYGLRDNSGSVQVKASGGSWATVPGYSSGTFTPVYAGTTTAGSCTYTRQLGSYVQVGKLVTFSIDIKWTACGTSPAGAPFLITGLPATSLNTANLYQSVGNVLVTTAYSITANDIFVARIPPNSTQIELKQAPANNASTVMADVAVDVAADITISGSYIAN